MKITCPGCGKRSDVITDYDGEVRIPIAGTLGLCTECVSIYKYVDDHRVRLLTEEEYADLPSYLLQALADKKRTSQRLRSRIFLVKGG
jgi:hypothetical protein